MLDKVWINKLKEFEKTGKAGSCPVCGSSNFEVETYNFGRLSVTYFCKDCGINRHFDGCISNK